MASHAKFDQHNDYSREDEGMIVYHLLDYWKEHTKVSRPIARVLHVDQSRLPTAIVLKNENLVRSYMSDGLVGQGDLPFKNSKYWWDFATLWSMNLKIWLGFSRLPRKVHSPGPKIS